MTTHNVTYTVVCLVMMTVFIFYHNVVLHGKSMFNSMINIYNVV